jgi:sec-independent protein translocase protein TatA
MPNLGGWEFVILIGVLVLLFGAKRLPDMARSIGQSARVFKGEMKGMRSDDGDARPADPPAAAPAPAALPPSNEASPGATPPPADAQQTPRVTQPGRDQTGH